MLWIQNEAKTEPADEAKTIMDHIEAFAVEWAPMVLAAVVTLIIGWWISKMLVGILRRVMNNRKVDPMLTGFLCHIAYMGLLTVVVISALGQLGVETTSFVAVIGAAGLAIGFALQGSLANFASGVMIIFFRPFKVGDFIEGGGVSGLVQEILMFATVLKTRDNKRVIVPNSALTDGNITNYTAEPLRRVDMVFGISYSDEIPKAEEVLRGILADDERILSNPEPEVFMAGLGDSSVDFHVRPWVKTDDYFDVMFHVTREVKIRFDREDISIPFPQRDVHLHQVA